ncbi:hypothetical protein V6N11_016050 [Hibiscus sabdariffa]|uniref:Uncharacterized protein n=1 Tax=Hibiscus sabdariffa TaxID=183260 RepID=A0ABR2TTZ2_9ROSI
MSSKRIRIPSMDERFSFNNDGPRVRLRVVRVPLWVSEVVFVFVIDDGLLNDLVFRLYLHFSLSDFNSN